jgi:hypothetical protein
MFWSLALMVATKEVIWNCYIFLLKSMCLYKFIIIGMTYANLNLKKNYLYQDSNYLTMEVKMKKWIMILVVMIFVGFAFGTVNAKNSPGPTPNHGDGIPDGSGDLFEPGPFGF